MIYQRSFTDDESGYFADATSIENIKKTISSVLKIAGIKNFDPDSVFHFFLVPTILKDDVFNKCYRETTGKENFERPIMNEFYSNNRYAEKVLDAFQNIHEKIIKKSNDIDYYDRPEFFASIDLELVIIPKIESEELTEIAKCFSLRNAVYPAHSYLTSEIYDYFNVSGLDLIDI